MGDRTPYTQRVDEDLQDFVDTIDNKTNLSKADVLDEALRRLRDVSTITDDGQFLVNEDYAIDGGESGASVENELLANQERIIALLGGDHSSSQAGCPHKSAAGGTDGQSSTAEQDDEDTETDTVVEAIVADGGDGELRVMDTEDKLESLAGEYDHDVCIAPENIEDVDFYESMQLSHTRRHLVPAITAMINYRLQEDEPWRDQIRWDKIRDMMRSRLDVCRSSRYNYRDDLIATGAIIPHPSTDERVVADEVVQQARECAAARTDERDSFEIDVGEFSGIEEERYDDDAGAYIREFTNEWDENIYYIDAETYREGAWDWMQAVISGMAMAHESVVKDQRPKKDKTAMYNDERAAGALRILKEVIDYFGVAERKIDEAATRAVTVETEDELSDWLDMWADTKSDVESVIKRDSVTDGDAAETFREIVGVDPVGMDGEEVKKEYREWVKQNHPDGGGDVDGEEFSKVNKAKAVLTG